MIYRKHKSSHQSYKELVKADIRVKEIANRDTLNCSYFNFIAKQTLSLKESLNAEEALLAWELIVKHSHLITLTNLVLVTPINTASKAG